MNLSNKIKFIPTPFRKEMVLAILADTKTITRRIAKVDSMTLHVARIEDNDKKLRFVEIRKNHTQKALKAPYEVGNVLWVRENFRYTQPYGCESLNYQYDADKSLGPAVDEAICYKINNYERGRPPMFMPKAACRLFLEVTNVECSRLQDITYSEAIAEGIDCWQYKNSKQYKVYFQDKPDNIETTFSPIESFKTLWQAINGGGSWEANPFVWVVTFKKYISTFSEIEKLIRP